MSLAEDFGAPGGGCCNMGDYFRMTMCNECRRKTEEWVFGRNPRVYNTGDVQRLMAAVLGPGHFFAVCSAKQDIEQAIAKAKELRDGLA